MVASANRRVLIALDPARTFEPPWDDVLAKLATSVDLYILPLGQQSRSGTPHSGPVTVMSTLSFFPKGERRFSSDVVAGLDAFRWHDSYENFRFVSLKLMNRLDASGTFRFVDREVFLSLAIASAFEALREADPDLLVFEVTPHEFLPYVLWSVAQFSGVETLFFQPSPITFGMFAKSSLDGPPLAPSPTLGKSPIHEVLWDTAEHQLTGLVAGHNPRYMQVQRDRDVAVSGWRQRMRAINASLGWLFRDRFPEAIELSGHLHRHGVVSRALKIFLFRSLQRSLQEKAAHLGDRPLPENDYCVYALHYEPERTSLPEGLPIDFQGDAVFAARALVPENIFLVAKEHYSQQTAALRGHLGRSPYFYNLVDSLHNTVVAGVDKKLSDLVGGAQCVFTLTGTIAIEAVLRGVPVGYFGNPWWAGLPGALRVAPGVTFADIVGQPLPTRHDVFAFFEALTRDSMIPGSAGIPAKVLEQRLGPLPSRFFELEAEAIVQSISALVAPGRRVLRRST
jgi:hypothetical protein